MNRLQFSWLTVALIFNTLQNAFSQVESFEFGFVSMNELTLKAHELDPTASAIILFDFGETSASFGSGTKFTRHTRIKIFEKSAIEEWGNLSIDIENGKLLKFNAITFNTDQGKIIQSTLDEGSLFKNKHNGKWEIRAAFPNVEAGSIIEFKYTVTYHQYFLPNWLFQYSIPVVLSEYTLFCPTVRGCQPDIVGSNFGLGHKVKRDGLLQIWSMENVPAFKPEPLMPPQRYYQSGLNYEFNIFIDWAKLLSGVDSRELIKRNNETISKTTATGKFTVDKDAIITGNIIMMREYVEASKAKSDYNRLGEEVYLSNTLKGLPLEVLKKSISGTEESSNRVSENYEIRIDQIANDSIISFNPFVLMQDKNVLRLTDRKYPVYFGVYSEKVMVCSFTIPDSYEVVELPESKILELPEGAAKSTISVTQTGNEIQVTTKFNINKPVFMPNEYQALREFFDIVIAMKSKPVVLRRVKS